MAHKLREEWEKLFGSKHDLNALKNSRKDEQGHFLTPDGVKTEIWEHDNVADLNQMMTEDWQSFLDGSDVYSELSEEEQNQLRANGPSYNEYTGD